MVAHPDDESFGLGAILAGLVDRGADVSVVCLTHGEASTLGAAADLGDRRALELRAGADALGITGVTLLDYEDGRLDAVGDAELDEVVEPHLAGADLLVVFEPSGVTGHPDHRAATAAAERVAARRRLAVLEWGVAPAVAAALNGELGTGFLPLEEDGRGVLLDLAVSRSRQRAAIACHPSQATGNTVLARRLELQGDQERVRHLTSSSGDPQLPAPP